MKKKVENIVRHSEVSEKAIEAYLVRRCKESGLLCLKYSNANTTGYPDRLVCLSHCNVVWVELKSKGKKPTKLQEIRHQELRDLDHKVWVISSKPEVDELIGYIESIAQLRFEIDGIKVREYLESADFRIKKQSV